MDFSHYYKIVSDCRRPLYTVTFYENGRVKFSDKLRKSIPGKNVEVFLEIDLKRLHLIPEGETIHVRADGTFFARTFMKEVFGDKRMTFPLVYEMVWDEKEGRWSGALNLMIKPYSAKKAAGSKKTKSLMELV